jgi:hypothetical protein
MSEEESEIHKNFQQGIALIKGCGTSVETTFLITIATASWDGGDLAFLHATPAMSRFVRVSLASGKSALLPFEDSTRHSLIPLLLQRILPKRAVAGARGNRQGNVLIESVLTRPFQRLDLDFNLPHMSLKSHHFENCWEFGTRFYDKKCTFHQIFMLNPGVQCSRSDIQISALL